MSLWNSIWKSSFCSHHAQQLAISNKRICWSIPSHLPFIQTYFILPLLFAWDATTIFLNLFLFCLFTYSARMSYWATYYDVTAAHYSLLRLLWLKLLCNVSCHSSLLFSIWLWIFCACVSPLPTATASLSPSGLTNPFARLIGQQQEMNCPRSISVMNSMSRRVCLLECEIHDGHIAMDVKRKRQYRKGAWLTEIMLLLDTKNKQVLIHDNMHLH